ncbi:MAG: class I SAM-dependent methyltransferase, partial [Gemmatimonadota bacterium]
MTLATELRGALGDIDIYFFDQLHRGQVTEQMRLLDAGCGRGRNLVGLLQHGASVWGVDSDPDAVVATRRLAA